MIPFNLCVEGIAKIEKCIGEYNIWELNKIPYAKFKIKIFMDSMGHFVGYSNLQVADALGDYYCAVGHGETEHNALEDTIREFLKMLNRKEHWIESDFRCSDPFDF